MMIETNGQYISKSGRKLSPAPKIDATTSRRINASIKRIDKWLLEECKKETANNDYVQTLLKAVNLNNMSPADRDMLNEILF